MCCSVETFAFHLKLVQPKIIDTKPISYSLDTTEQNSVGQLSSLPSFPSSYQLPLERPHLFVHSGFFTGSLSWQTPTDTVHTQDSPLGCFQIAWPDSSSHPMSCAVWRVACSGEVCSLWGWWWSQKPRLLTHKTLWQTFITIFFKLRGNSRTNIENYNCLSCLLRKQTLKKIAYNCIMSLNDWWFQLNKDSWICVFNSSTGLGRIGILSVDRADKIIFNTSAQNTSEMSSHA